MSEDDAVQSVRAFYDGIFSYFHLEYLFVLGSREFAVSVQKQLIVIGDGVHLLVISEYVLISVRVSSGNFRDYILGRNNVCTLFFLDRCKYLVGICLEGIVLSLCIVYVHHLAVRELDICEPSDFRLHEFVDEFL